MSNKAFYTVMILGGIIFSVWLGVLPADITFGQQIFFIPFGFALGAITGAGIYGACVGFDVRN